MHIVITGASSGIGAALARELHRHGAVLTLVARREALLQTLAAELGERCQIVAHDITCGNDWLQLAERFGPIDVFINNAGIQVLGPFALSDATSGRHLIEVDLHAPLALARAVIPPMIARGAGVLVNISSVVALTPPPGMAWYAAAKAGLAAFSESLRAELADSGVHVLTVYPGPIDNGSPQEAYDLYGRDSIAGKLPTATAAALAIEIRRAIRARRKRLIYPRFYVLAWWLSAIAHFLVSRTTPQMRSLPRKKR